jgi:hypothetical protein
MIGKQETYNLVDFIRVSFNRMHEIRCLHAQTFGYNTRMLLMRPTSKSSELVDRIPVRDDL